MNVMESYKSFVENAHKQLFPEETIEQLMVNVYRGHRRKRFVAMYLLSDKDVFHKYYALRNHLNLVKLFDQIISGLLHETEKNPLKVLFVETHSINENMIFKPASSYEIREFEKDLHAFSFYETKKVLKETRKDLLI